MCKNNYYNCGRCFGVIRRGCVCCMYMPCVVNNCYPKYRHYRVDVYVRDMGRENYPVPYNFFNSRYALTGNGYGATSACGGNDDFKFC